MPAEPSEIVAHIDGASRGNPGPAAYGVVVETPDGAPVAALSKFLGRATNNVAEYQALLAALDYALENHHRRLRVFCDSELLARQIEGRYKVKSPDLKPLYERARAMIGRLESFRIRHVPRAQNAEADRLANAALDAAEGKPFNHQDTKTQVKERTVSARSGTLRASATYRQGALVPQLELPLAEGEEVDLEIRRKK
jgi:ribonuclease HI